MPLETVSNADARRSFRMCSCTVSVPAGGASAATGGPPSIGASKVRPARCQRVLLVAGASADVSAALADELTPLGTEVLSVRSVAEAARLPTGEPIDILMVNVDRTDEASWLRAAEYRQARPATRVWLYTVWSSSVDRALAKFVQAEAMIYYDGRASQLRREVRRRLQPAAPPSGGAPP
jgi:hypothetical protein